MNADIKAQKHIAESCPSLPSYHPANQFTISYIEAFTLETPPIQKLKSKMPTSLGVKKWVSVGY